MRCHNDSLERFTSLQNFVIRVLRERTESIRQSIDQQAASGGEDALSNEDATSNTKSDDDELEIAESTLPADQPIFKSHAEPNQRPTELDTSEVNPKEVHHVVVPYSQLKYQRMYDWPPEPKYARVTIPPKPAPAVQKRKTPASGGSKGSSLHVRRRSRTFTGQSSGRKTTNWSNSPSIVPSKKNS